MSSAERTWVGGRVAFPAKIDTMGETRASMILWIELPDMHIVGQVVEDPSDPQATLSQSLIRAMNTPLVGKPRRPKQVRVADAALADELRSLSFLHVEVGPTPEFDKVARALGAAFGEPSYFSDPSFTASDIEKLFVAARALWSTEAWTGMDDDPMVHVIIPALGINDGCLTIMSSAGVAHGFVFFESYEEARAGTRSGLYLTLEARAEMPDGMRKEVAENGWPLLSDDAYPLLLNMANGKPAPVFARELRLATALAHALGTFMQQHPSALELRYLEDLRESYSDGDGLEVTLTVPHPLDNEDDPSEEVPRAPTLSGEPNPYGLPVAPVVLQQFQRTLGTFTVHRVIGLFCAAASIPTLPAPMTWMSEIMQHVRPANEAQARHVIEQLMVVYNHVISTLEVDVIDGLIPEGDDEDACREWARGYAALLTHVDPRTLDPEELRAAFTIQVLAELPEMLNQLDAIRGPTSRDDMLSEYRDLLADDADFLHGSWSEARTAPVARPPEQPVKRDAAKVGRNDPCPCGSGKKYKKCCALN